MAKEVELKFIEIDKEKIIDRLLSLGAKQEYDDIFEIVTFHGGNFHPSDSTKEYIRVRKENGKIVLAYKGPREGKTFKTREEIEVNVDDFSKTIEIISKLGFEPGKLRTKRRIHFTYKDACFEIDEIEDVPPFLEIETKSEERMEEICEEFGFDISEGHPGSIVEVYPKLLDS